jgi:hypothetical protein
LEHFRFNYFESIYLIFRYLEHFWFQLFWIYLFSILTLWTLMVDCELHFCFNFCNQILNFFWIGILYRNLDNFTLVTLESEWCCLKFNVYLYEEKVGRILENVDKYFAIIFKINRNASIKFYCENTFLFINKT